MHVAAAEHIAAYVVGYGAAVLAAGCLDSVADGVKGYASGTLTAEQKAVLGLSLFLFGLPLLFWAKRRGLGWRYFLSPLCFLGGLEGFGRGLHSDALHQLAYAPICAVRVVLEVIEHAALQLFAWGGRVSRHGFCNFLHGLGSHVPLLLQAMAEALAFVARHTAARLRQALERLANLLRNHQEIVFVLLLTLRSVVYNCAALANCGGGGSGDALECMVWLAHATAAAAGAVLLLELLADEFGLRFGHSIFHNTVTATLRLVECIGTAIISACFWAGRVMQRLVSVRQMPCYREVVQTYKMTGRCTCRVWRCSPLCSHCTAAPAP